MEHDSMTSSAERPGATQAGTGRPRFRWSVWRVTGIAAALAFLMLALSLVRLDRTATTLADRATGAVTENAAVPVPAQPLKSEPAKPPPSAGQGPPAAQPRAQQPPAVEQRVVQQAPPIEKIPAPLPTVQSVPPVAPAQPAQPSAALEAALSRAEAGAAQVLRSTEGRSSMGPPLPPPSRQWEPAAASSSLRVFLHFAAGDREARDKAERLAGELRRRGVTVAEIRGVPQSVRSSMIRYYHESDRPQLQGLASALADSARAAGTPDSWYVSDFTRFAAPPRVGNVEVWIPNG
jgi:hypothetical protein